MKKILQWVIKSVIALISVLIVILLSLALLKIPINLDPFKGRVEAIASRLLDRPVTIEKSIFISSPLKPAFLLEGLRINNPPGFSQDTFLFLESARIEVELVPLLRRKLYISDFDVQSLDITLEENIDGDVNWLFAQNVAETGTPEVREKKQHESANEKPVELSHDTIVIKRLQFTNIGVKYHDPERPVPTSYHIEKCTGSMIPGKPLHLDINGEYDSFPYGMEISLVSLEEYLLENKSWVDLGLTIAETEFTFSGDVDFTEATSSLTLRTNISGTNLKSLDHLLELDLPPFKSYGVTANLKLQENRYTLENLEIKTGSSSLNGKANILVQNEQFTADVIFKSPNIQLDDFIFDDWHWSVKESDEEQPAGSETQVKEKEADPETPTENDSIEEKLRKIADPEILQKVKLKLSIKADNVLSGKDELGRGSAEITLQNGKLAIAPLQLQLPMGSAQLTASITPGKSESTAEVKARVNNFDIGVLVRRENPDSKMEGLVNLDTHLTSTASSFDQVLANGNGYFDFSGQLRNISSGIIDLWAVNLIAAIVSSTDDSTSQINCAVGRWTVKDGLLTPDTFFIDTTKIRICGRGKIDFKNQNIDLSISPTPKRPQFFSLATPLAVKGNFRELDLGISSGGVLGTAIRFVASPVTVPVKRIVREDIPETGSDACNAQLGPDTRDETVIRGCR